MFESLRAQALARERNYPELIELAQTYLAEKTDVTALQDLGNVLLSNGLNSQAAQLFKKAYELDPKHLSSLVGFANSVHPPRSCECADWQHAENHHCYAIQQ